MLHASKLLPGALLGDKYRYERELGRGGMGRVVEATHVPLGRRVALKILTEGASPEVATRFVREARLAARLVGAHVVRVLDAGELEPGVPFIAMELLEGTDLAALVRAQGALPVSVACSYVAQACEALAEAHALGMVHRDVKPANLFLVTERGAPFVKVLDFGITKADPKSTQSIAPMTAPGSLLGTPGAMAPEQLASSHDVDARADVWALGVVLHTLLAGRMPFERPTLRATFEAIVREPPPPITPALPAGLRDVLDRCLRKNKSERYANAAELGAALVPFVAPPQQRSRRRPWLIAVAAFASMSAGAALVVAHPWRSARVAPPPPTPSSTEPAPIVIEPLVKSSGEEIVALTPSASSVPLVIARPPPPTPTTATTITATTTAEDGRYLPKQMWARAFNAAFPDDLCQKLMRRCYAETDAECLDVARPIVKSCVDQELPAMPENMHGYGPAQEASTMRISHCIVPAFHAQQKVNGRPRNPNCQ